MMNVPGETADGSRAATPPGQPATSLARSANTAISIELAPLDLGRLRQLRVVVEELSRVLDRIRKGTATANAYAPYLETVRTDIPNVLGRINVPDDSEAADAMQRLRSVWDQMRINPLLTDPEVELPAQEQLHHLELLDELCGRMVYQTGFLTIPARVNDWLRRARPGYYIPFHAVFDDELPSLEDRARLLRFMAWSPETLRNGLVDVATGLNLPLLAECFGPVAEPFLGTSCVDRNRSDRLPLC